MRAESLVIDQAGKGTLQALISLKPGAENKFTGETPLIPVFLQVEGADAITVTPGDEASSSVRKSRIAFKKSGRFSISLQNAVPDQQVVIDFATLKDKEFADSTRCMVIPVRLAFPKRKHKE